MANSAATASGDSIVACAAYREMSDSTTTKETNGPKAAPASAANKAVKPKKKTSKGTKKKKRKSAMNDPDGPVNPLNAYNFFFKYERAALLHSDDPDNAGTPPPTPQQYYGTHALHPHLKDKVDKKNRQHRKTHGKIGFTDLVRLVAVRWQKLPLSKRAFFQKLAERDIARYKRERKELLERRMQEKQTGGGGDSDEKKASRRTAGGGVSSDAPATVFSSSSATNISNADGCLRVLPASTDKRHHTNAASKPAAFSNIAAAAAAPSRRTSLPTELRGSDTNADASEPFGFSPAALPVTPSRRASLPTKVPSQKYPIGTPSPSDEQTLTSAHAVTAPMQMQSLQSQVLSQCPFPAATALADDQTVASNTTAAASSVATSATAMSAPASFPSAMQTQRRGVGFAPAAGMGAFADDDKTASNTGVVVSLATASTTCGASLPCNLDTYDDYASIAESSARLDEEEFYQQQLRRNTKELEALKKRSLVDNIVLRKTEHHSRQQAPRARAPQSLPPARRPHRARGKAQATAAEDSLRHVHQQREGRSIPPFAHDIGVTKVPEEQVASSLAPVVPPLAVFDEEEMDFLGTCRWEKYV